MELSASERYSAAALYTLALHATQVAGDDCKLFFCVRSIACFWWPGVPKAGCGRHFVARQEQASAAVTGDALLRETHGSWGCSPVDLVLFFSKLQSNAHNRITRHPLKAAAPLPAPTVCIAPHRDQPAGFCVRRAPAGAEVNSFAGARPADGDEPAWLAAWGWDLCAPGGLCERAYEHLGLPPSGWPALKALPEVSLRFRSRSGLTADLFATNYQCCSSPKACLPFNRWRVS